MNYWKVLFLGLLTVFVVVSYQNCAQKVDKSKKSAQEEEPPVVDPTPDDNEPTEDGPGGGPGATFKYGGTTSFVPVNNIVFSDYEGEPVNNPRNIVVNVNLVRYGSKYYGGHVTIAYEDDIGQGYEEWKAYFESGGSEQSTKYNQWIEEETKFHGVFEDFRGAIVLVIDQFVNLGDGEGIEDNAGGSIWFKNFGRTPAPHPPTYCWFVSLGPYDCRPWPSGHGMDTNMSVNPASGSGYTLLGHFSGLSLKKAFNNQLHININP